MIRFILLAFAVSRVAAYAAGIRFDASPLESYYQYAERSLLQDRLLETLFYLHAQPPLFNLMLGLTLKAASPVASAALHVEFVVIGLVTTLCLYALLLQLGIRRWIGALLATAYSVSPAVLLFENWLFYEYVALALLLGAAVALHRFLTTESRSAGVAFFTCVAALIYTRSIFQLVWMVGLIVGLLLVKRRRLVLTCCAVPLALVAALYGKNLVLFGQATTSSWLGMNLARMTLNRLSDESIRQYVAAGHLHPISLTRSFADANDSARLFPVPPTTGIPLLDRTHKPSGETNFHSQLSLELSRQHLRDAMWVIRNRPDAYVNSVFESASIFFAPITVMDFTGENRRAILGYDRFVNDYVFVHRGAWPQMGRVVIAMYGAALAYTVLLLLRLGWLRRRPDPGTLVILFLASSALYVFAVSSLGEIGENQRIRFIADPLVLVCVVALVGQIGQVRRARITRRADPHINASAGG